MFDEQDIENDLKNEIKNRFSMMGGVRAGVDRFISMTYAKDMKIDGVDIRGELISSMKQETLSGISSELLRAARNVHENREIVQFEGAASLKKFSDTIIRIADHLHKDSMIVLSPSHFTILKMSGDERLKLSEALAFFSATGTVFAGDFGGHPILVDPYGNDTDPALIVQPGWFTFEGDDNVSFAEFPGRSINENELRMGVGVATKVVAKKVRLVVLEDAQQ